MKDIHMKFAGQYTEFMSYFKVILMGITVYILTGCAQPPAPVAADQSFRVSAVSARYMQPGERRVPLALLVFENQRFPPADLGLKRGRVLADLERVMARSLIPASRQGARDVRAEMVVYAFPLRNNFSEVKTHLNGWLDFYDTRSGARVASTEMALSETQGKTPAQVRAIWRIRANPVREYEKLLQIAERDLPKFLPRP